MKFQVGRIIRTKQQFLFSSPLQVIHSFNKLFLSTYVVPGCPVVGIGEIGVRQTSMTQSLKEVTSWTLGLSLQCMQPMAHIVNIHCPATPKRGSRDIEWNWRLSLSSGSQEIIGETSKQVNNLRIVSLMLCLKYIENTEEMFKELQIKRKNKNQETQQRNGQRMQSSFHGKRSTHG